MGENRSLYDRSSPSATRCASDKSAADIGGWGQTGGAPFECNAEIGFEVGIRGIEQLSPWDHDDINTLPAGQWRSAPENLSNQTFSTISPDRVSQLFRGDDTEASRAFRVGRDEHREIAPFRTKRQVEDALEFPPSSDPAGFREALGRHGGSWRSNPATRLSGGDGQALAPFGATALQHQASILRRHAHEKAMRALATPDVGLESNTHCRIPCSEQIMAEKLRY
jgi:hypothetical protein